MTPIPFEVSVQAQPFGLTLHSNLKALPQGREREKSKLEGSEFMYNPHACDRKEIQKLIMENDDVFNFFNYYYLEDTSTP